MPNLAEPIDLSPAQWIWFPSQRTLANSMVLFRREVNVASPVKRATGHITADSRYRLTLNGQRVQWGPPPCDPRWMDADPVDLTTLLKTGPNVIGAQVLYYGSGDGTWATGKPGFLFRLDLEYANGRTERIVSDPGWQCCLDRAYRPGQYRRWYLRAFQEEFDARRHPHGWDTPGFTASAEWLPAMAIPGSPSKPTLCLGYSEYSSDSHASNPANTTLLKRQIPLLRETLVPAKQLQESGRVEWLRDPLDWFEFRTPNAFRIIRQPVAEPGPGPRWPIRVEPQSSQGIYLTFEFPEQIVGWPYFTIDTPEGTIVEVMTQEAHDPAQTAWLDSQHYSWARFICRKRLNRFEHFDFESLRWLQLHIRNTNGSVVVSEVGVRRRIYDWPHPAAIKVSEPKLQRLFDASVNTLHNCAQETCVDGMGRERQQYSGDGSHQLHAIWRTFGETRLPARFLRTFSQGS
ncbi:MAG: alpha-L-rhamnosidase N-terminal domain-containing protein, partial [Bacillota bacterium]